jgi:hypothetical protein
MKRGGVQKEHLLNTTQKPSEQKISGCIAAQLA